MIKRCVQKNPKRDAVLICEGAEGEGKTTYSIAIGYYISSVTGRVFNHTRVFADLQKMIDFLKTTEKEIAVWDEPALQALSGDVNTTIVRDLTRLLMMARKKRHFLIINLAYFNKFNDYIVWQRPLGMIHIYSRNEVQAGRFVYIKRKNLERLWQDWRRMRKRNYKKWSSKRIRGTFPDVMNPDYKHNILSDFNINYYEKAKDEAIKKIGAKKEEKKKENLKLLVLQWKVATLPYPAKDKVTHFKVSNFTINNWKKLPEKYPNLIENELILKKSGPTGISNQ